MSKLVGRMADEAVEQLRCRHCGAALSRAEPRCPFCKRTDPVAAFAGAVAESLAEQGSDDLSQSRQDFDQALKLSRSWHWFVDGYALQLFAVAVGVAAALLALGTRLNPLLVLLSAGGIAAAAVGALVALARPRRAERLRLSMLLRARRVRCRNCGFGFLARPQGTGELPCPHCSAKLDAVSVEELARAASRARASARLGTEARESAHWRATFRSLREDGRYRLSNVMLVVAAWLIAFAAWTSGQKVAFGPERLNQPVMPLQSSTEYVNGVPLAQGFLHGGGYVLRDGWGFGEGVLLPERRDARACFDPVSGPPLRLADLPTDTQWGSRVEQEPERALQWFRSFYGERAVPAVPLRVGELTSVGVRLEGAETAWEAHAVPCGGDGVSLVFVRRIERRGLAGPLVFGALALGTVVVAGRRRRDAGTAVG